MRMLIDGGIPRPIMLLVSYICFYFIKYICYKIDTSKL